MGWQNAARSIGHALEEFEPDLVLTCGFAGGLHPALQRGAILFETEEMALQSSCASCGGRPGRFLCHPRIVSAAEEKLALWERFKCDAVEMESGVIRRACTERGIASATIRVILDPVDQNLPLDFETILDDQKRINGWKLASALLRSPRRISGLFTLRKESNRAAKELGGFLERLLAALPLRSDSGSANPAR